MISACKYYRYSTVYCVIMETTCNANIRLETQLLILYPRNEKFLFLPFSDKGEKILCRLQFTKFSYTFFMYVFILSSVMDA